MSFIDGALEALGFGHKDTKIDSSIAQGTGGTAVSGINPSNDLMPITGAEAHKPVGLPITPTVETPAAGEGVQSPSATGGNIFEGIKSTLGGPSDASEGAAIVAERKAAMGAGGILGEAAAVVNSIPDDAERPSLDVKAETGPGAGVGGSMETSPAPQPKVITPDGPAAGAGGSLDSSVSSSVASETPLEPPVLEPTVSNAETPREPVSAVSDTEQRTSADAETQTAEAQPGAPIVEPVIEPTTSVVEPLAQTPQPETPADTGTFGATAVAGTPSPEPGPSASTTNAWESPAPAPTETPLNPTATADVNSALNSGGVDSLTQPPVSNEPPASGNGDGSGTPSAPPVTPVGI